MKKEKLVMTKKVKEHIEGYYNTLNAHLYYNDRLEEDVINYIKSITNNLTEIKQILSTIGNYNNMISLIKYLTNGEEKDTKDIIRQAYVISNEPIPFNREIKPQKCNLTKEQIAELEDLNIPFSIKEIKKNKNYESQTEMILINFIYLDKIAKKTKKAQVKKMLKIYEDEYFPTVPKKEVKEIHIYYPDYDEEVIFLDEEGLHQVTGKKAKVEFLDGNKIIGYLGSDFKDKDGDECLSLFEAYDEKRGFYDYHTYKLKDTLRMDVLYYPRHEINFEFNIKVRHIKKYIKGVSEGKDKIYKINTEQNA